MDRIQKNEKKIKKPVFKYLIYLLLATSIVSGVTFSRYISALTGKDSARAAVFDYEVAVYDPVNEKQVNEENWDNVLASIFATSKLSEAEDCLFDEVAIVREITVTNKSEVAVNAQISEIMEISEIADTQSGIVWCIFDEDDLFDEDDITGSIVKQMGYSSINNIPDDFDGLETDLIKTNQIAVTQWNKKASLGFTSNDNSRTLTIVFWAEYDEIWKDTGMTTYLPIDLEPFALDFKVTQID